MGLFLDKVKKIVTDADSDNIKLYLIRQKSEVSVENIKIFENLANSLKEITVNQIEYFCELSFAKYNIIGSNTDVWEQAKKTDYKVQIENVLDKLDTSGGYKTLKDGNFFIYRFGKEPDYVYAFRRIKNFKTFKKGFIGSMVDGCFKELEQNDILGTDDNIDIIIYKDDIAIFNHISFERIFKLTNEFVDAAKEVLDTSSLSEKNIRNFENFKQNILKNTNYVRRVAKLKDTKNTQLFLEDLTKTKEVIEQFNLGLEVDTDKCQIIYDNAAQTNELINLMQDAYYITIIGDHKGIDERR